MLGARDLELDGERTLVVSAYIYTKAYFTLPQVFKNPVQYVVSFSFTVKLVGIAIKLDSIKWESGVTN